MSINLSIPEAAEAAELKPRITVVGVGGAGGNAVNNMIRLDLVGVEYLVCNTDAQALRQSRADRRIQLGNNITQGLGAGSRPDIGRQAAEEAIEEIANDLRGVNMAFIAAGMGGGTGTGAAPVIARACRELGILTVGVVTKPFQFEGAHRMRLAEAGIQELEQFVDTLIIIPNQNLFRIANEKTTFADAFSMADDVLYSGVRGVTDLMVMPGLINLDFADVRAVMSEMGKAMMGTGEAAGERRALDAAEAAIANPLLDDASMKGAKGVLINITGGADMTLFEVDEAANRIRAEVDDEAFIIFGAAFDQGLDGKLRVSVVATGIDAAAMQRPLPMIGEPRIRAAARPMPAKEKVPAAILVPKTEVVATATAPEAVPAQAAVAEVEPVAAAPSIIEAAATEAAAAEPVAAEAELEEWATLVNTAAAAATPAAPESPAAAVAATAAPAAPTAAAAALVRRPAAAVHELKRPAAMPAMGTGDAFIPPAPVEATGEARTVRADPFAQADMVNSPKEIARESKVDMPKPAPVSAPAPAPAPTPATATAPTPTLVAAQPAPKPKALSLFERVTGVHRARVEAKAEPPAPRMAMPAPASPRLGGVALQDRPAPQRVEDDLLDIPAFLRRQAN